MSEAILFAVDAPHVTDVNAARQFVEHWQDGKDAPTSRIGTFFVQLLQTWPVDGSRGVVWHEDSAQSRPSGPLLEMVFELSEFDEQRLQQLRAIAKHHGVHVFDPEGHVLYLSDGTEAGVPAMSPPVPGTPHYCKSGVRFDGVYECRTDKSWSYLCFTAEGQVLWQSIGGQFPASQVMQMFIAGDGFVVKGKYQPGKHSFTAKLGAAFGNFRMEGALKDDGLHVHSERTNGRYPYDSVYVFRSLH